MLGNIFGALLLTLLGAALLFNGYRWFRLLLPVWAFLVGYGFIASLLSAIFGQGFFGTLLTIIPGIVVGIGFAALSYLWYAFAVLFWAATLGYVLFAGMLAAFGVGNGFIIWLAGLAGAFVFAGAATRSDLKVFLPIFLTAGAGATLLLSAWLVLWGRPVEELNWGTVYGPLSSGASGSWLAILLWMVLTFVGIGAQSATNQRSLAYEVPAKAK
ncbi:MAG: hypothetical protein AB4911_19325 [Oscillochloridaceae bacterium umkhey_bin13]